MKGDLFWAAAVLAIGIVLAAWGGAWVLNANDYDRCLLVNRESTCRNLITPVATP